MKLAFALFKYFPYGGLQRDCLKIAEECLRRGHQVDVYCLEWSGSRPSGLNVEVLKVDSWINYRRYERFAQIVMQCVDRENYHGLVGFNKMTGLDLYYAADPCYAAKVKSRSLMYRYLPRTQSFLRSECAVFSKTSHTHVLFISPAEQKVFEQVYEIQSSRMTLLPPGIQRDRLMPAEYQSVREEKRSELGINESTSLLLMIGSGFKTKGVARSLRAIAALPENLRSNVMLYIIGQDNPRSFERMAAQLGIRQQVFFLGGRDDIPELLFAADLLLHPAYRENTGTVLLEAMAAGLPQIVSGVCGYSFHIKEAGSGLVLDEPFDQVQMNVTLEQMLMDGDAETWRLNARRYISHNDIFSMPERAVDTIERVLSC